MGLKGDTIQKWTELGFLDNIHDREALATHYETLANRLIEENNPISSKYGFETWGFSVIRKLYQKKIPIDINAIIDYFYVWVIDNGRIWMKNDDIDTKMKTVELFLKDVELFLVKINEPIQLEIYAVRNKEGKYFKNVGRDGSSGKSWVDDINKAKLYTKIGQARSRVSFYYNNYPKYGIADIIKITSYGYEVINEKDRVLKQKTKKNVEEQNRIKAAEEKKIANAKKAIEAAQRVIENSKYGK